MFWPGNLILQYDMEKLCSDINWWKCSLNLKLGYTKCILIGHGICVSLKEKTLGVVPLGSLKTKIYVKLMTLGLYLC